MLAGFAGKFSPPRRAA